MQRRDDASLTSEVDPALLEESAEDLYENAPCGYLSTSADGTIVKVNHTFLDWTGYGRQELLRKKRFSEILTVGGRVYYETHYAPLLLMQGSVSEIAVDVVCADGNILPVLVSAAVRQDRPDRPPLIRTTIFAASDRREYERELMRSRQRAEESEARARVLAQTLQESLIPPAPPQIPGLDIAGVYRPAGLGDEVGGDFYDVFQTAGGDWAIAIGDVSGKGAEAASITALARYTVRAAAIRTKRPRLVLEMLNRALLLQKATRFCTAVYCTIRQRHENQFRISLAVGGHPLPLLLRAGSEPVYAGRPGMLLGTFEDPDLQDTAVELNSGDVLLFYTDGLIEGRRGTEFFGEEALVRALVDLGDRSAREIATGIATDVVEFQEGFPRDDIAVIALKVP